MVTEAATEGAQVFRVEDVPEHGFFAAPTIVEGPAEGSPITREEIFGPVLTLEPVASVEAACELVEAQPYALTGGLFSPQPRRDRRARRTPARRSATSYARPRDHRRRSSAASPSAATGSRGTGTEAGGTRTTSCTSSNL